MYRHYIDAERVSYNSPNPFIKALLYKKSFEILELDIILFKQVRSVWDEF